MTEVDALPIENGGFLYIYVSLPDGIYAWLGIIIVVSALKLNPKRLDLYSNCLRQFGVRKFDRSKRFLRLFAQILV